MIDQESIFVAGAGGMLATAFRAILPRAQFVDRSALDITNLDQVVCVLAEKKPRVVINCAAYTKVDLAEQNREHADNVNGYSIGPLALACRRHNAVLVHFSTDYVFDGTIRRPLRPDDPVGPQSAYGKSKLLGEQLLQQNAPPQWLLIRTAWLYGPGGPNFPQAILNAARAGKPLSVVDDQIGSPTFTFDLASATLELLDNGATGIWHLVNDGAVTWHDFAAAILEEFHIDATLSRTTSAKWKQDRPNSAIRPGYSVLDITPFEKLTGHRTRHWREALREYARIVSS